MHYVRICLAYETDYLSYKAAFNCNLCCYWCVLSVLVTQVQKKLLILELDEAGYPCLPSPRLCPLPAKLFPLVSPVASGWSPLARFAGVTSHFWWLPLLPVFCKIAFYSISWQAAERVVALSPFRCSCQPQRPGWLQGCWGQTGCAACCPAEIWGVLDLFKLRMGEAGVLVCQLGWCQESFRHGGEVWFFFFWLACPCLEGGLLGDPCRKGASLFCLYYWRSYSDWAAAELGSLGWELWVRRCILCVLSWKENVFIVTSTF